MRVAFLSFARRSANVVGAITVLFVIRKRRCLFLQFYQKSRYRQRRYRVTPRMLVVSTRLSVRFAPGQKEDEGIRGFRSDAIDGEQFLSQF